MNFIEYINMYFEKLKYAIDSLNRDEINKLVELVIDVYKKDANIFIFGNGGSASTASHFACDINKGVCCGSEKRYKIISLTDNIATIMAYSNDVGYEYVFVEQLKNFLKDDDLVIGISGSGNSKNILKAIEYANIRGNITIGFTGYNGGILTKIAKYSVNTKIDDMQISEDIHSIVLHLLMKILNAHLSNNTF